MGITLTLAWWEFRTSPHKNNRATFFLAAIIVAMVSPGLFLCYSLEWCKRRFQRWYKVRGNTYWKKIRLGLLVIILGACQSKHQPIHQPKPQIAPGTTTTSRPAIGLIPPENIFRTPETPSTSVPAVQLVVAQVPGSIDSRVTQENIHQTICVSGYTAKARPPVSYTDRLKRQQLVALHYLDQSVTDYEEDHLIPLELGGNPTDPNNLWPEPYPRAKQVDRLENDLHAKVCDGAMELRVAQMQITQVKHTQG